MLAYYCFRDEMDSFMLEKHWENEPAQAIKCIYNALEYAWYLPRFEASDFVCAFVAANKEKGGGNIYVVDIKNRRPSRIEKARYSYTVLMDNHALYVKIYDSREKTNDVKTLFDWLVEFDIYRNDKLLKE